MRRLIIGIFTAIVVFVLFVVLCTFVRRPYETVILERFGRLIEQKDQTRIMYNWYFKMPTDRVVPIDNRLHLYPGFLQEVVTSGREPINIRTFAAWKIENPVEFYKKTGGNDEEAKRMIDARIRALVGQKMGTHGLDELFNNDESKIKTRDIEQQIAMDATEGTDAPTTGPGAAAGGRIPGLKTMGIRIVEIGFSRMAFPPDNTEFVYGRMVAELNTRSRGFESEGLQKADTIRSEGRQEAAKTRQDALAKADQVRGQGDREAAQILADATKDPAIREFYQDWKQLEFLKASLLKNNYLVLPSDHPILKILFQNPSTTQPLGLPTTQPSGASPATAPATR